MYTRTHMHTSRSHTKTESLDVIGTATAGSTISEHSSISRGISHLPRSNSVPFFHSGRLLPFPALGSLAGENAIFRTRPLARCVLLFAFSRKTLMRVKLEYLFSKGCPRGLFYGDARSSVSSSTFAKCSVNNTEAFFPASNANR